MASTHIELTELPGRFEEIIALTAAGAEVVLTDKNIPKARLVPLGPPRRVAGLHAGAIETADDFDTPLPDGFWTGEA